MTQQENGDGALNCAVYFTLQCASEPVPLSVQIPRSLSILGLHFPHSKVATPLTAHLYSTGVQVNLDPSYRSQAGMPTQQSKPLALTRLDRQTHTHKTK